MASASHPIGGWVSRKQRKRSRAKKPGEGWFRSLVHEDGADKQATQILRANSFLAVRGRPSFKKLRRALSILNTPA